MSFLRKDRKLGVAEKNSRYDLPLNKGSGSTFLILLIALMTFLTYVALAGFLLLGKTTTRWESGLKNKVTIEIPAENPDGVLLEKAALADLASQVQKAMEGFESVESVNIMSDEQILALVEPWLGHDVLIDEFPLPVLIQLEMNDADEPALMILRNRLRAISTAIHLDTHQDWLNDIMRVTGGLQFAASLLVIIIAGTTIVAIAGGVHTRMDLHRDDVELLHLMGANDLYITKQFSQHALAIGLKGSVSGLLAALVTFGIAALIFATQEEPISAAFFQISWGDILIFILLPILICGIAGLTARFTVLRSLTQMP